MVLRLFPEIINTLVRIWGLSQKRDSEETEAPADSLTSDIEASTISKSGSIPDLASATSKTEAEKDLVRVSEGLSWEELDSFETQRLQAVVLSIVTPLMKYFPDRFLTALLAAWDMQLSEKIKKSVRSDVSEPKMKKSNEDATDPLQPFECSSDAHRNVMTILNRLRGSSPSRVLAAVVQQLEHSIEAAEKARQAKYGVLERKVLYTRNIEQIPP